MDLRSNLAMMEDIEFEEEVEIDDLVLCPKPIKVAEIEIDDIKQEPLEEENLQAASESDHDVGKKFKEKMEEKFLKLCEENVEKEMRMKNKPSECKKISLQDREFPTNSQKTCTICSKTFSRKTSLKVHIAAVHEGLKPFECPKCDKKFGRKEHLKEHVVVVHDKIKRFKCHICDKSYGANRELKRHVKSIHDN